MEKDMEPSIAVFGSARLADIVQEWLNHAVERGLMWSTLSNCESPPHVLCPVWLTLARPVVQM